MYKIITKIKLDLELRRYLRDTATTANSDMYLLVRGTTVTVVQSALRSNQQESQRPTCYSFHQPRREDGCQRDAITLPSYDAFRLSLTYFHRNAAARTAPPRYKLRRSRPSERRARTPDEIKILASRRNASGLRSGRFIGQVGGCLGGKELSRKLRLMRAS